MFVIRHADGTYESGGPDRSPTLANARKWRSRPEAMLHGEGLRLGPHEIVRCDSAEIERLQDEAHEAWMRERGLVAARAAEEPIEWVEKAGTHKASFRGMKAFAFQHNSEGVWMVGVQVLAGHEWLFSSDRDRITFPTAEAAKAEGERVMREHISKKGGE